MEDKSGGDKQQVNNRYKGLRPRWKPGQSGNPKGRPPKNISITSKVKELLEKDAGDGKTYADLIAETIIDSIIDEAGNLKHGVNTALVREVLDRVEGKVLDRHKIDMDTQVTLIREPVSRDDVIKEEGSGQKTG